MQNNNTANNKNIKVIIIIIMSIIIILILITIIIIINIKIRKLIIRFVIINKRKKKTEKVFLNGSTKRILLFNLR